jgi:hypothetical protein
MTHFFMVALYGTAYALAPFPSPARVRHSYHTAMWMICG